MESFGSGKAACCKGLSYVIYVFATASAENIRIIQHRSIKHNTYPAFNPTSTLPLFLNGKQITLAKTFDAVSPVTHQVLYKCSAHQTKPDFRRGIFLREADLMEKASRRHHGVAISACRSIADLIQVVTTSTSPAIAASGRGALVVKGPYGFRGCSWNHVGSCLPSALHYAGLPAGCLNTLYHDPKDAGILTSREGMWDVSVAPFVNSGQIYMSTERIIVNSKVAEEFCKALLLTLEDFSDTQGWDVNQLVSDVAVINNKKLITDALSKGAQLLADDMGHGIESASKLRLTIITGVRKDMYIYYRVSFGPVVIRGELLRLADAMERCAENGSMQKDVSAEIS
ncbi:putative aldehyde dehydrogenase [Trichoderma afarasin]